MSEAQTQRTTSGREVEVPAEREELRLLCAEAGDVAQLAERSPSVYEALGLYPALHKHSTVAHTCNPRTQR